MKIGLVTIQRDRGRWLHEWIAFHHLIGISSFYIYAHRCSDHTKEILETLTAYYPIKAFLIDSDENRIQLKVYQHAYETFGHECDWMGFIDGDEFLFPAKAASLQEILREHEYNRVSALGVYWACFGSSGHINEPDGLVLENYRYRAKSTYFENKHIKSLVRTRQNSKVGPNAHMFDTPWGTIDELGRSITFGLTQYEPSYETIRINHYITQSYEYFKTFKQKSGAADAGAGFIRPDDWWNIHDVNEELDESVIRFIDQLKAEITRTRVGKNLF